MVHRSVALGSVLTALAVMLGSSCSVLCRRARTPEDPLTVIERSDLNLHGRAYVLTVLRPTLGPAAIDMLQISGDDIVISFHTTTGPSRPTISGQTISFGGHQLELLAANQYQVDGVPYSLPPHSIYLFSNGTLVIQLPM